jgi:hypothetical protein
MECRICNQRIGFLKDSYPGRKRKSTWAVHESELSDALTQANGEVVTPHPGVQRKLRHETAEQAENAEWYSKATA